MRRSLKSLMFAAAVALPSMASAQIVLVGTFDAAGAGRLTKVGPNFPVSFSSAFAVPTLDGIFASLPAFTSGSVQSISVASGSYSVANFMQIGGYTFSLTNVAPGSFSSANCSAVLAVSGQSCSPAGTGWNFTNLSGGKNVMNLSMSFSFSGEVTTPTAQTYDYMGTFTSQLTRTSYQKLFTKLGTPGSSQAISYSLNDVATATVPEPATVALMGTGLLALAGIGFARRRQA
jgi:hypothetical protein